MVPFSCETAITGENYFLKKPNLSVPGNCPKGIEQMKKYLFKKNLLDLFERSLWHPLTLSTTLPPQLDRNSAWQSFRSQTMLSPCAGQPPASSIPPNSVLQTLNSREVLPRGWSLSSFTEPPFIGQRLYPGMTGLEYWDPNLSQPNSLIEQRLHMARGKPRRPDVYDPHPLPCRGRSL